MAEKNTQKSIYERAMERFGNSDGPNEDPNEAANKLLSYARGAGGNTGIGDSVASGLMNSTRDIANWFQDPSNKNTYAGASAGDTLSENADAAVDKYPLANRIGGEQVAGSLATLANMALPGSGSAVPLVGRALMQAVPGALHGAYTARPGEDRTKAAAIGAGTSALFPFAEGAVDKLGFGRSLLNMLRPEAEAGGGQAGRQAAWKAATQEGEAAGKAAKSKSDAANQAAAYQKRSVWERAPTIPPDAIPVEARVAQAAEANRTPSLPPAALREMPPPAPTVRSQPMLPPPDDSALPDMMATRGIPKPRNMVEFRGPYEPGVLADESKLIPQVHPSGNEDFDAASELGMYARRRDEQLAREGAPNGTPTAPPEAGPGSRGQQILEANRADRAAEPSRGTMPAEYSSGGRESSYPTEYDVGGKQRKAALRDEATTGAPPSSSGPPSGSPSGEFNMPSGSPDSGQPLFPSLHSIPPAPTANTVMRVPGGNAPVPGYMRALEDMQAPKMPELPAPANDKVAIEDFKREYNKKHNVGKKTDKPGKRKSDK